MEATTVRRDWVVISEAAALAGVGTSTIDRAVRRGELVVYSGLKTGRLFFRPSSRTGRRRGRQVTATMLSRVDEDRLQAERRHEAALRAWSDVRKRQALLEAKNVVLDDEGGEHAVDAEAEIAGAELVVNASKRPSS